MNYVLNLSALTGLTKSPATSSPLIKIVSSLMNLAIALFAPLDGITRQPSSPPLSKGSDGWSFRSRSTNFDVIFFSQAGFQCYRTPKHTS